MGVEGRLGDSSDPEISPAVTPADSTEGRATGSISVLIADDHALLSQSLQGVLDAEPDIETVGVAGTLRETAELLERTAPDVLLLDHRMPDGDGIAAIADLTSRSPATAVVVVTASTADEHLLAAVDGGAAGFVSKTSGLSDLTASVRAAASGEAVISVDLLNRVLQRINRGDLTETPRLTSREDEVLRLVSHGMTNAQIAAELFVSVNTVRNHVANISSKLNAHSKLEALAIATRRGLIPAEL